MNVSDDIFREYDIRGVVGTDFDTNFAYKLGQGFATYLRQDGKKDLVVSVGQDARLSSPEISSAVIEGLVASGAKVYRLGLITTPLSYYSTFSMPLDGAIMVTGSHNPPDYNGFKISRGKGTIFGEEIQVLRKIIQGEKFENNPGGKAEDFDIKKTYLERFGSDISIKNKVKAVIDCGNGAAGVVARDLYEAMGLELDYLFEKPDGTFPNHHPDPTVEKNLQDLKKHVQSSGAQVGIGFDGDADRIGVVDHEGRMLFGDELMAIFARSVLADYPGTPVIGDVKCSDRLYKDIEAHNGKAVMYKTGHSLIKNKMKEMDSKFSGEMSGHVFFADRNYGYDDAVYAGARLIEILSQTGKTIPQLLEGIPEAFATPEIRIDTTEEKKRRVVEEVKKEFSNGDYKVNDIDGIRISFDDGFGLVRASNTQPVVVCRFEATSKARLEEIQNLIEGSVRRKLE